MVINREDNFLFLALTSKLSGCASCSGGPQTASGMLTYKYGGSFVILVLYIHISVSDEIADVVDVNM